ncbi:hypothetical protein [Haliangium sp.]|uniref:hypothetical protein n=1 Tax=Haliangium sp. TaxID=2663208 RepID=UPI003D0E6F48
MRQPPTDVLSRRVQLWPRLAFTCLATCFLVGSISGLACSKQDAPGEPPTAPSAEKATPAEPPPGHGAAKTQAPPTPAPAAVPEGATSLGGLIVEAPSGWIAEPVSSSMRRGQWKIKDDAGEAELVVYYFGQAGAGTVERNLERWYGQFQQADGKPTREVAEVGEKTVAGMKVTRVSVGGRYVAAVRPGAAEKHDVPDARMLAAIVEAPDGAYYFKMVGTAATVEAAASGFDAMLASMRTPG